MGAGAVISGYKSGYFLSFRVGYLSSAFVHICSRLLVAGLRVRYPLGAQFSERLFAPVFSHVKV